WHRFSLAQLAAALAAPTMAERGIVPVSRLSVEAIVCRVAHALGSGDALGRYARIAKAPGFSPAIASVLTEVRLAAIAPEVLGKVAPDLLILLRAYEAELTEGKLTDWPGTLAIAAETAANGSAATQRLAKLPMLLLDVSIASQAELTLIAALCSSASKMLATVPAADEPTIAHLRDGLRLEIEDLDRSGPVRADVGNGRTGSLARLQCQLFREDATAPLTLRDDQVLVFSAPGESRECAEIVRRVLALARDAVPFDRIAVLLRSPEDYRAHLKEAFARADIPVHFARGAVRPHPAGRAFYALLECAAESLSAQKFAEYVSLGQVPDAAPGGTPPEPRSRGDLWSAPDPELVRPLAPVDASDSTASLVENAAAPPSPNAPVRDGQLRTPRRWERLLVESAVIGGRDRWRRRIDGLMNELRRK